MEINFKTLKKIWTAVITIIAAALFFTIIITDNNTYDSAYELEFNGVIDAITYGNRKQAIVKIKNQEYSLSAFGIRKGEDINVGDSLYKAKKSEKLELHSMSPNGDFIFTKIYRLKSR